MRPPVCATCKHDLAEHPATGGCEWTGIELRCLCPEYVAPATTVMADTRQRLEAAEKRIAELATKLETMQAYLDTAAMMPRPEERRLVQKRLGELERIVDLIRDSAHEHDALSRDGMLYVDTHEGEKP